MPRRHYHTPHRPFKLNGSGCLQKNRYSSKDEAESVKADQEAVNMQLTLRTYRCSECRGWHLTRADDV